MWKQQKILDNKKMNKYPFLGELERLRKKIDAPSYSGSYHKALPRFKIIERKLSAEGIEISIEDLKTVGPYLTYEDEHLVILYIKNSNSTVDELLGNSPESRFTPKFHITWCDKVNQMYESKRLDRYVVSQSAQNLFVVEAKEDGGRESQTLEDVRLFPCQYCLDKISYRGFSYKDQGWYERIEQVEAFAVKAYLEENLGNLTVWKHLPRFKDSESISGTYTVAFVEISRRKRENNGWKCSKCKVDMKERKDGLHCHHINGVKSDNSWRNLEVLCALCHKNVDQFHAHMEIRSDIEDYIRKHRPIDPEY